MSKRDQGKINEVEQVRYVLRWLNKPKKLEKSVWVNSCLITRLMNDNRQLAGYQALKEIFTEVLTEVETESPEDADILRGRFWEGLKVTKMLTEQRPYPMGESTFYIAQKEAIDRFARILSQFETKCQRERQKNARGGIYNESLPHQLTTEQVNPDQTRYLWLRERRWRLIVLSLIILSGIALLILNWPYSQSICGESELVIAPLVPRFERDQGVSLFTKENTEDVLISNFIRSVTLDERGLWLGHFIEDEKASSSLGIYDKQNWAKCSQPLGNVNAIQIDQTDNLWVATEKDGVWMYNGRRWRSYSIDNGLPSNDTFGITVDSDNNIWVATWNGIAKFDGRRWTTPYRVEDQTAYNNRSHTIAFDEAGNIWIGHISDGVSHFNHAERRWLHITSENGLGGNQIRDIEVYPATDGEQETVWIASADGGVSRYEAGQWTVFTVDDGLPSIDIRDIEFDKHGRAWVATANGVAYFDEDWIQYHAFEALSIAFGSACLDCPFDNDHVWTGTTAGLTHSRVPYPENAIVVDKVCFIVVGRDRVCPPLNNGLSTDTIITTYPEVIPAGTDLRFEITVTPEESYQLRADRGDFLSNVDEKDEMLYGAWHLVPVDGVIESGQSYTFTDFDNPIVTPALSADQEQRTFSNSWRVWMHTRYVGPIIQIVFTVQQP